MEKISGIIPSTPRVTTVDLQSSASAARPGSPPFGRPMGTSALAENKAAREAEIAKAMSEKFFNSEKPELEEAMEPLPAKMASLKMVPRGSFVNVQA